MKVTVKSPFFDDNGLHQIGEVIEVKEMNPETMEEVKEEKKKATKK